MINFVTFLTLMGLLPVHQAFTLQKRFIRNGDLRQQQQDLRFISTFASEDTSCKNVNRPFYMSSVDEVDAPSDADDMTDVEEEEEPFVGSGSTSASSGGYESIPNGLGEWEEMHGNYVLRPPSNGQEPRCVFRKEIMGLLVFCCRIEYVRSGIRWDARFITIMIKSFCLNLNPIDVEISPSSFISIISPFVKL